MQQSEIFLVIQASFNRVQHYVSLTKSPAANVSFLCVDAC